MNTHGVNTRAEATTGVFSEAEYAAAYPDGMERHYWTQARFRVVLGTLRRHGALTRVPSGTPEVSS